MGERERWTAAVQAHLDHISSTHDLGPAVPDGGNPLGRAALLLVQAGALQAQFERTGAIADLNGAVDTGRAAADAAGEDSPHLGGIMNNLANALRTRFNFTEDMADLDDPVAVGQQAVRYTPEGHPRYGPSLSNLAAALRTRFSLTGSLMDLEAAVGAARRAVRAAPADAVYLTNLANTLVSRFERLGSIADLDAAVGFAREAVEASGQGDPNRARILSNLSDALRIRSGRTAAAADVEGAVEVAKQAVEAAAVGHPDRLMCLSTLGNALVTRYERTRAMADLDSAVEAAQQALQSLPAGVPRDAMYLCNLGMALQARFGRAGVLADLNSAIDLFDEAVQGTATGHPDRPIYLTNFGTTLRMRFERTGATADLDFALTCLREAVRDAPGDHPDRGAYLANLGGALRLRFASTGAMPDLDAAVEACEQAVRATVADYPHRAWHLSSLGNALISRFARNGETKDLDAAIARSREAVQAARPGHPDHAMYVSNLGIQLWMRFERNRETADLDAAITCLADAVKDIPADQPYRAQVLSNLGDALEARFRRTGDLTDLDAAVENGREAMRTAPADHPDRAVILSSLGDSLRARYRRAGTAADRDAAEQLYTAAAHVDSASASTRISAFRRGASLAAETDQGRAADLLEAAVLLLPLVAPRFLDWSDQQYAIGGFAGLAADAAALALSNPAIPEPQRATRALRLLEAARGVLLSQALSTRGDLSELRARHPRLATRFAELRNLLDQPGPLSNPGPAGRPGESAADAIAHAAEIRRQAHAELNSLLISIRKLDGFHIFALPPSARRLEAQAAEGPLIIFNVSAYRSDAILLTAEGITSLNLPRLDQATVAEQVATFYESLDAMTGAEYSLLERREAQQTILQVLAWLWDVAAGPVLRELDYLGPLRPETWWPRLWWIPTGRLSLLPIHAAGHHGSPSDPDHSAVMDCVISSYTPTVGALAHARTASAGVAATATRSLIVAMPTTPDLREDSGLSYVPAEAALVAARLPSPTVLTESDNADTPVDQVPTKANVLENLPGCAIAHFACHGQSDFVDPSRSRLLLHDHARDPLTVAALASLDLDHARLAYLSACTTARMSDTRLLDEAIHLSSAFQLAGFPHVIGTLWEIDDETAITMADTFYAGLSQPDGTIDPHRAANALHHATRARRNERPIDPYFWASHIHVGA